MRRFAFVLFLALLMLPTSVSAAECQFVLGFKTLRNLIGHDVVGECLENEHYNEIGDSVQQTTGGLLAWRKADNWTAFTDGHRTWINGPNGLVQRLNTERFAWEADYAPGGGVATPTPAPVPTSTPNPIPTAVPETVQTFRERHPREFAAIKSLPWINEWPLTADYLQQLAQASRPVFWVWMEQSGQDVMHEATVIALSILASADERAALQIIEMPFLRTKGDVADYEVLFRLTKLAGSDPEKLWWVLSHSMLQGGITDEQAPIVALLFLALSDPESAAAIEALPWIQDGIARPPPPGYSSPYQTPTDREQSTIESLVNIALLSREMFLELVRKPWIQDGVTAREGWIISSLREFAHRDGAIAQSIIRMPFLETIELRDSNILNTLDSLYRFDPSGVYWLLSNPRLAGGITDEREAIVVLLSLERQNPEAAAVLGKLPWIRDGILASEVSAVYSMHATALVVERLFQALVRKHWVRDGLTSDELRAIRFLRSIGSYDRRRGEAVALDIIEMPFLFTVDGADAAAIDSLQRLFWAPDSTEFWQVFNHPLLRNGITDNHVAVVSILGLVSYYAPDLMTTMLNQRYVDVERSTLIVADLGKVDLAVISTRPVTSENMAWLKHAVRTQVEFMGAPFPRTYVALWVHDKGKGGGGPTGVLHVGGLNQPAVVAHEAAHVYWPFFPSWIAEGGAEFMERISENARIGSPVEPLNDGKCKFTDTLSGHDKLVRERSSRGEHEYLGICPYSLGSGLFVDLYHSLGDEDFRQSFHNLYLKLRDEAHEDRCYGLERGVCYVKAAFVADAAPRAAAIAEPIINRWYYGSERGGR